MKKNFLFMILYVAFWLVLAERVTTAVAVAGIAVSSIVYIYSAKTLYPVNIKRLIRTGHLWLVYIIQLLWAILVSNIQVAAIVLSKKMPIEPVIVTYQTGLQDDFFKTVLANSITLTPGTMSVDINDTTLTIHCLNKTYADSLTGNVFEKTLRRIQEA